MRALLARNAGPLAAAVLIGLWGAAPVVAWYGGDPR